MARRANFIVICFFFLLIFGVTLISASSINDLDARKMMEDMARSVPNRCFTPRNLESVFLRACKIVLNDNTTQCSFAWTAFKVAFGFKDPNAVTAEDYDTYFDVLPTISPANSAVYWSGMNVKNVVKEISEQPKISSSVNQVSSRIINIMIEDDSVLCWCGNKNAFLDFVNPCPITPVVAFWQAYSTHFGEAGRGVVFFIGYGNKDNGVYQNSSFFANFEFPKLNSRISRLVVIDIYDCNSSIVEKCGEGTLKVLEDEAISKYGKDVGYNCEAVCGNSSDIQEIFLLANQTLQIIREEQDTVTTVSFNQSTYTFNETDGYVYIGLVLSNVSSVDVTVQVINKDITARSRYSSDYYSGPYSVTFPAGVTTTSFRIYIVDDSYLELTDETFLVFINDLLLPKHITYGDLWRASVTIVSNEIGVSFNQSSYRVNETNSQVVIVLFLTSPLSIDTDVTVHDTDSWRTKATDGIDYFPGPFEAKFPAGETNASFRILIADDEVAEYVEPFYIYIDSNSLYYLVKPHKYTAVHVFIDDNDFTTINFNQSTYVVNEDNGYVYPVLILSKPYQDYSIRIEDSSVTATGYYDHDGNDQYVRLDGMTIVSFRIQIYNDDSIEGYETFDIYISSSSLPHNIYIGSQSRATVTIVDDDSTTISFDEPRYSIDESSKQIQPMLVLSKLQSTDITVQVIDFDIIATRNVDYASGPYSATIPAGSSNTTFSVSITDDNVTENAEAFLLNINPISLSNTLVFGGHGGAVVTIEDDDYTTINFEKPAYSIDEYDGAIHPVLILSNPLSKDITIKIVNTDGSADDLDDDYGPGPYFVKLTAGDTRFPFEVSIHDDNKFEENENFFLSIDRSSLPCDVNIGNQDQATVTILEDEYTNCTVSTISGNVNHNRQRQTTMMTFEADNKNATYTCKLDRGNFKYCTSPVVWRNLKKGKHTATVKASCVVGSISISSTKLKIEFQVR